MAVSRRPQRAILRALPYAVYLRTAHWRQVRLKALHRAQYRCEKCQVGWLLQVHHRTYVHLGEEQKYPQDLQALCRECHRAAHGKRPGHQKMRTATQTRKATSDTRPRATRPKTAAARRRSRMRSSTTAM